MKKADPRSFSEGKGTVPDPDLEISGGRWGGGRSSRPLDKGRPGLQKNFSVLLASVWSKNMGGDPWGDPGSLLWIHHRGRFERTCSQPALGI